MSVKQNSHGGEHDAERRSIGQVLKGVASGDAGATGALWDEYFPRLVRWFRWWYGKRPRPVVDEEDLALDVLECVCRRARAGAYHEIATRDQFWKIVRGIGQRTLLSQRRRELCLKRGGESGNFDATQNLDAIPARAGPFREPDQLQPLEEFYRFLWLEHFHQPLFWPLTQLRLQNMSRRDIAKTLHISERAVCAKLRLMLKKWLAYASLSDKAKWKRVKRERRLRQLRFDKKHPL